MEKTKKTPFVFIENGRTEEYKALLQKILDSGEDPYDPAIIREGKYHKKPILFEGDFWIVTKNDVPYKNAKKHFLLISKEFCTKKSELSEASKKELDQLSDKIIEDYRIEGGMIGFRFGEAPYSGATVARLHVHIIEPDIDLENYEPVNFKIGKLK